MAQYMVSPKITITLSGTYYNTLTDSSISSVSHPALSYTKKMTNGVSANEANRGWQLKEGSVTSGNTTTIDLYDMGATDIGTGNGLDGLGMPVVNEEIVAIAIVNENAVTAAGYLEIFPNASDGWTPIGIHTVVLGGALAGQGILLKCNVAEVGFNITDASNHKIDLKANGGDVEYSIYLLYRHDDNESSSSSSSSSTSSLSSSSNSSSSTSSISTSSVSSSSGSSSSISSSSWSSVSLS